MGEPTKPDIITGSGTSSAPMESEGEHTGGHSGLAPAQDVLGSIGAVQLLSLLQTDLFDLQQKGCKLILTDTMSGRLGILIELPKHRLGFEDGRITIDGTPL